MRHFLFTSEAVGRGHPDKVADQIADAILDACLSKDPKSKVACEVLVSTGLIVLAGEISTKAHVDYAEIARKTVQEIGYTDALLGFDARACAVIQTINKQSPDIAQGVNEGEGLDHHLGAGDQGMMFGYACLDTKELMPLPIALSHKIMKALDEARKTKKIPYLGPDSKTQVTVEYKEDFTPLRIHTIVLSVQHKEDVDFATIDRDIRNLIKKTLPKEILDEKTFFYINPTGRFVLGGPGADCGLTGRKITVDTYGGMARNGGGAFSGKDPTKVDRSGAYAARYIAKNIVAASLAKRCEVQVSYAIGVSHPISIYVNTFGTGTFSEEKIEKIIPQIFDLSPKGMIEMLNLRRPIYLKTAYGGQFGRQEEEFTWEKTDKVKELIEYLH